MSNTIYNKITANNEVLIDLSTDTVTSAEHIVAGHVGHLADGTVVTGIATSGGGGSGYTRTVIMPQQTVTPVSNGTCYIVSLSATAPLQEGSDYIITYNGTEYYYTCALLWGTDYLLGQIEYYFGNANLAYPFGIVYEPSTSTTTYELLTDNSSQVTVKIEEIILNSSGGGGSANLGTKTITVNGTYSASNDSLDGYSSVTVSVPATAPNLQSKTVTPTTSTQTITADANYDGLSSVEVSAITTGTAGTPTASKGTVSNHSVSITPSVTNTTGYITGGTKTGTAITVTASELASGNKEITSNGTNIDVVGYSTVSVAVPASSKNVQTVQSTSRRNNTALGSITSLTCSTAGTYDVYWTCARTSTSQTWGSQLYISGTAYGTENTTWSNNVQNNHLTGVVLSANDTVAVYGRSRSGYYIHAPQLTIVQTA